MRKTWTDEAWEDYFYWQGQDRKTLKKINSLIHDIDRKGYECAGHPEPLVGNWSGFHSVHIDKKNRIVFRIINGALEIAQCGSHYRDK